MVLGDEYSGLYKRVHKPKRAKITHLFRCWAMALVLGQNINQALQRLFYSSYKLSAHRDKIRQHLPTK